MSTAGLPFDDGMTQKGRGQCELSPSFLYNETPAIVAGFHVGFADEWKTNTKSAQNVLMLKAPLCRSVGASATRLLVAISELSAKLTEGLFYMGYCFLQSLRHFLAKMPPPFTKGRLMLKPVYGSQVTVAWLAGQSKTHLCVASSIRALPETEIPPRFTGGYLLKKSASVKVLQFKVLILEREWYIIKVIKWRSVSFERRNG